MCSTLNENSAKKLAKKRPLELLAHTETQLVRVYPAGMRIDSSNFNPVQFWAYGVQMAALNYQTDDATATHVNAAMFEQNNRRGYVLKPRVMRDPSHVMYRRFNPTDKCFDGVRAIRLCVKIVSGQYVSPAGDSRCSVYVETELIGIPADNAKKKTKTVFNNSINPVWNENFTYLVLFEELAFVKFLIVDANTSHPMCQRVVPLKNLRYGYRHVDMRTIQNKPLPLTTLFVYTCGIEDKAAGATVEEKRAMSTSSVQSFHLLAQTPAATSDGAFVNNAGPLPRRKTFMLPVYGVISEETYTQFKITQNSSVTDVIKLALDKREESLDNINSYVLLEEVGRTWKNSVAAPPSLDSGETAIMETSVVAEAVVDGRSTYRVSVVKDNQTNGSKKKIKRNNSERSSGGVVPMSRRVLNYDEKPLEAQARWQGSGHFILKKIGDDPSSRAWLTSLRYRGDTDDVSSQTDKSSWDEARTFLVCVFNVAEDIPYVILKVPTGSTAQDILAQALIKARRMEDPTTFILVEELEWNETDIRYRVLDDDEIVYATQNRWSRVGRLVLEERFDRKHQTADEQRAGGAGAAGGGLIGKTSQAIWAFAQKTRLQTGLAVMARRWRAFGLPVLPGGQCLQRPDNCREGVIREAARSYSRTLVARKNASQTSVEKIGDGDDGGGLDHDATDGSDVSVDDDENDPYVGFYVSSNRLLSFWRS